MYSQPILSAEADYLALEARSCEAIEAAGPMLQMVILLFLQVPRSSRGYYACPTCGHSW